VQVARSRESIELRLAAIEALGEAAGERGLAELSTLARGREELELRLKAIETYASSARPTAAVTMLKAIIAADGNEDVRMQALESLSEVDNDIAWKAVAEIARSSADAGLRARAVELIRER
ncbi:MAG: HEAT repeat domain-containing protein, partial [Gemmatimonadaceae bacterium]|nr:HEAT repeat domain-containing protein [Gemmatimonadaceae bacterium]